VRELAAKLGVADHVEWLGEDPGVHDVLPGADALLAPSEFEGFGLAALEAMACGVPVVATDAGALPEVVADGVTGRLAPVGDVDALAEGCLEAFARPEMREAARQRAVDAFEASKVVPRYEALYERVLAERTAARA
jgi:glycosyltransferase involved in cell wall biosynthesis